MFLLDASFNSFLGSSLVADTFTVLAVFPFFVGLALEYLFERLPDLGPEIDRRPLLASRMFSRFYWIFIRLSWSVVRSRF
jgi:hypothetical protein